MLPEELPDRWESAISALIVLDGTLQDRLQRVYVNPLREDVVRHTLDFLRDRRRTRLANQLEALEPKLRRPEVDITDVEAGEAVDVLMGVTHEVFRFYPDEVSDNRPPEDEDDV